MSKFSHFNVKFVFLVKIFKIICYNPRKDSIMFMLKNCRNLLEDDDERSMEKELEISFNFADSYCCGGGAYSDLAKGGK